VDPSRALDKPKPRSRSTIIRKLMVIFTALAMMTLWFAIARRARQPRFVTQTWCPSMTKAVKTCS